MPRTLTFLPNIDCRLSSAVHASSASLRPDRRFAFGPPAHAFSSEPRSGTADQNVAERRAGRAEERAVAIASVVDLFPERLAEMQHDFDHRSRRETGECLLFARVGHEAHRSRGVCG